MGIPQKWHRRAAMVLAGQLPDNDDDAEMVMQALQELVGTFLSEPAIPTRAATGTNVVPFNGA